MEKTYFDQDLAPGNHVCLRIRDDGEGISEDDLEKIFDPFFSTRFPGRGLGLPVVLGIVSGHGGAIHVSSKRGEGTTVTVLFPPVPQPG